MTDGGVSQDPLLGVYLLHLYPMLVILGAAVWTLGWQVLFVGLFLQPVVAPKAHGVSTVAKLDCSVCDVQRLGAKGAGVCVIHHE